MIVNMPDPNPGRCLNHRWGTDSGGYPLSKRCLDYENHNGRCTFPVDPPRLPASNTMHSSIPEDTWVYQMAKLREALHDLKEAIIDEFCRVTRMHR